MARSMIWFRKGLRLHDNGAVIAAMNGSSSVVPVFILDRWHCNPDNMGNIRFEFLMQSLRDLDCSLKQRGVKHGIIFLQGEPEIILPKAWKAFSIDVLAFDDEDENEAHVRATDTLIKKYAAIAGVRIILQHSHWLHSPAEYASKLAGTVPTTMTQFRKLLDQVGQVPEPREAPASIPDGDSKYEDALVAFGCPSFSIPDDDSFYSSLGRVRAVPKFPGGETNGLKRLEMQIFQRAKWAAGFEKPKTSPNSIEPDTTVLSPYITHGCLSVRQVWWAIRQVQCQANVSSKPPVSLDGQLMFRELWFIVGRLSGEDVSDMEGNSLCRNIPWGRDDKARDRLSKWANSETGFPFIDAIMAQLRTEGWIHHLARHAVACFATRGDLWCDWRDAARYFDRWLIDADWTLNHCNWQWLSCSAFFYQYFRCYSPIAFGKKTDPNGDYIRKYVPVLALIPAKYIYEPWKAPREVQVKAGCVVGEHYPHRMIEDHLATSKANMNKIKAAYDAHNQVENERRQKKKARIS